MLDKIKLKKNQLACFHYHQLTAEEQEFIIFNIDPVKFLNDQIKLLNAYTYGYTDEMLMTKFPYVKKELDTLKSIIKKLDIFDKR